MVIVHKDLNSVGSNKEHQYKSTQASTDSGECCSADGW